MATFEPADIQSDPGSVKLQIWARIGYEDSFGWVGKKDQDVGRTTHIKSNDRKEVGERPCFV